MKRHVISKTYNAFTLIEILLVVVIIAIIASILIPVLGKIRQTADQANCASNLRQIGVALSAFRADNENQLPGYLGKISDGWTGYGLERDAGPRGWSNSQGPTRMLISHLQPYFSAETTTDGGGYVNEIMVCPANNLTLNTLGDSLPVPSYYLSMRVRTTDGELRRPFSYAGTRGIGTEQIRNPARAVALFDMDQEFAELIRTTAPKTPASTVHGKSRNVLYFDGHVQAIDRYTDPHED